MNLSTIVLAWIVDDVEIVRARRADLGERPITRVVRRPVACVWLRAGGPADVARARTYAATRGEEPTTVYVYPLDEEDPIGRAKREIARARS